MKRYDLEPCGGYAESCNAKILEDKTGDYVLYDEVQPQLSTLAQAVLDIQTLIDESQGVVGLHLNGDVAPWSELTSGGRFGEWLGGIDEACTIAREVLK